MAQGSQVVSVDAAAELRAWRVGRGFTQQELADLLGTNNQTISDWEVGRKTPCLRKLIAIEDLTEIPIRAWAGMAA